MITLFIGSCRCTSFFINKVTKSVTSKHGYITFLKPAVLSTRSWSSTKVKTNVTNDVILYAHDGTTPIRVLNILAVGQLIICNFFAVHLYNSFFDVPVDKNDTLLDAEPNNITLPVNEDVNEVDKSKNVPIYAKYGVVAGTLIIGYAFMIAAHFFTIRAIKCIILRKGGASVSIITHSAIGRDGIITVPLKEVSSIFSRTQARTLFPIKLKNKFSFYLLDMHGKFKNSVLFDATVGLKRKFSPK